MFQFLQNTQINFNKPTIISNRQKTILLLVFIEGPGFTKHGINYNKPTIIFFGKKQTCYRVFVMFRFLQNTQINFNKPTIISS